MHWIPNKWTLAFRYRNEKRGYLFPLKEAFLLVFYVAPDRKYLRVGLSEVLLREVKMFGSKVLSMEL